LVRVCEVKIALVRDVAHRGGDGVVREYCKADPVHEEMTLGRDPFWAPKLEACVFLAQNDVHYWALYRRA